MRWFRSVLVLCATGVVAFSGCGDLTSGGIGELEVVVAADSLAFEAISEVAAFAVGPRAPDDAQIVGTLAITIRVYLLRAPGQWLEVTNGPQIVSLPLGSGQTDSDGASEIVARKDLPAGPYRAVRTVFLQVRADIESGLEIDGEPFTGLVDVALGPDSRIDVAYPLEVHVSSDETTSLVIDLHTRRWIRRLDRDQRRVPTEDFEDELRVRHPM